MQFLAKKLCNYRLAPLTGAGPLLGNPGSATVIFFCSRPIGGINIVQPDNYILHFSGKILTVSKEMLGENNYTCVIENIFGSSNQSLYFVVAVGKLSLKNNKEH